MCGLIPDAVKGSTRVCRDHFRDEDFEPIPDTFPVEYFDTLRDDAVPSRNLPLPTPDFYSNSSNVPPVEKDVLLQEVVLDA